MALRRKKAKRRGEMHPLLALPELAKQRGLIGATHLDELGIWRGYLHEFARRGLLARVVKFRNKIGVPVAVGALERALQQKRCDVKRLTHFAAVCRVARVIEPYVLAFRAFAQ